MLYKFYNLCIAPRLADHDLRNREVVLNVLLMTTIGVMLLAIMLQTIYYAAMHESYLLPRIGGLAGALALVGVLYKLSRSGQYWTAAGMLVATYVVLSTVVMYMWGTRLPVSVLLSGLIIVLAGILLSARFSLYALGLVILIVSALRAAEQYHFISPDQSWINQPASLDGAFGPFLLLAVLAVVSWLFNFRMELSLRRAHLAEEALTRQKALLEMQVQERTQQLHAAQVDKMQQLYRFAELGQLSTALLHELANHLTTLTLDIESLEAESRSHMLRRAKRSILYIDDMVQHVRDQLHGKSEIKTFNIVAAITEVVKILEHKAVGAGVSISWEPPLNKRLFRYTGDPVRFRQLTTNIISNAIDAYDTDLPITTARRVLITAELVDGHVMLSVTDWGKGIPASEHQKIFEPFYSTKNTGMGMGLFISKQLTEEYFSGTITLSGKNSTSFTVTIPLRP